MRRTHRLNKSRVQKNPISDVRIGSTCVGKGVFATRDYRVDWVIGEILGDIIDDPDYGSDYCIDTEDGRCLEPYTPFRYLNHSCQPNCELEWLDMNGEGEMPVTRRLFLSALQEIRLDDELTIDYEWSGDAAIPCRCRALSCRGWVVNPKERL
ncbi:MAG: SET domain-containing protein-lysine N-methyltransferase [Gemmataceae bacterium]